MAEAEPRSITRRSLVAALALSVAAVPSLPALAREPDPIFAAIEAHRRAYDGLANFADQLATAEQAAWHAPRGQRRAAKQRLKQAYAEERRLGEILGDATARMVTTVPRTLEGAVAALAYVRELYANGYPVCEQDECMTLLASIEAAICRSAGLPAPDGACPT